MWYSLYWGCQIIPLSQKGDTKSRTTTPTGVSNCPLVAKGGHQVQNDHATSTNPPTFLALQVSVWPRWRVQ